MTRLLHAALLAAGAFTLCIAACTGDGHQSASSACLDLQECCDTGIFAANGQAACDALTQANDSTACAQGLGGYVAAGVCSGSGAPADASLLGTYTCTETVTITANTPAQTLMGSGAFTISGSGDDLTLSSDSDAASCGIKLTASGDVATVDANQTCPGNSGGDTVTILDGMVALDGSTLTLSLDFRETQAASDGTLVTSEVMVTGTCSKM